ncbi:MAG TPA: FAD-binding oxidoreductase [Bacteroidia bacterium]|nr:FAD-binding oxidoreductase [Bacteroidia bacterium]
MILQNWWYTTLMSAKESRQKPLMKDIECDILIVGGGAAGLAAAFSLMDKGIKVVLLERNICGGSSTGKSAGFLTPDSELELSQLIRRFGKEDAKVIWQMAANAAKEMADTIRKYDISCDLQEQDSLYLGNDESGWKEIIEESEARKSLGYTQTLFDNEQLKNEIGSAAYAGGVRYSGTFGINPLLYAQGMKSVLINHGVKIYEASEVREIKGNTVKTHLGSVKAAEIIFCADKIEKSLSHYADNIYHAQTFLSVSEILEPADVKSIFPNGNYQCWDSDLVYSYFRLTGDNRLLLGGGTALTTFSKNDVTSPSVINHVIKKFKNKFPQLEHLEFVQYWPGRIDTTRDLIPTVTRDDKNPSIHFVLGCVGLPWATLCGDFAARHAYDDASCTDHKCYDYFRSDRKFLIPIWMENFLGKQIVFSLNNGWAKYYQKD